jgi:hypothetical protein
LPVIQDFGTMQDFKVVRRATREHRGKVSRLRNQFDPSDTAAVTTEPNEKHHFDITVHQPELVIPESCSSQDSMTAMLLVVAENFTVNSNERNESDREDQPVDGQTIAVSALKAYTCGRTRWITERSAVATKLQPTYKSGRRGAESNHSIVAKMAH